MKKLISLVLALAMVLAVAVASAATITLSRSSTYDENDVESNTNKYYAYKIFDATKTVATVGNTTDATIDAQSEDGYTPETGISYFVATDNPWKSTLEGTGKFDFVEAADGTGWTISLKSSVTNNEQTAIDIAAALKTALSSVSLSGEYAAKELTPETALTVDDGYYMVVSELGENLVLATSNITITEKNDYPHVTKTIADVDKTAQIGDTIDYELVVNVPKGANQAIVLTDEMTEGLTFKEITSVTSNKTGDNPSVDYTLAPAPAEGKTQAEAITANGNKFTITFDEDDVSDNAQCTITVVYKAILNDKAKISLSSSDTDGNINKVDLKYGNKYQSKPEQVETDTQKFTLDKIDATTSAKLSGAEFELYKATLTTTGTGADEKTTATTSGSAIQLISVAAGETYRIATAEEIADNTVTKVTKIVTAGKVITVNGVAGDEDYALLETKAPAGYNKLDDPIPVDVNTLNTLAVTVPNNSGTVLPSTGGIGTTIFYIVGGMLLVGAAIVLVARRKASEN